MRRITIYTDEDSARKATAWLEQQGLDYMSEDYAGPAITRRAEPVRRSEPERHEGGASLLLRQQPRQQPKGPGRKIGPIAEFILQVIKDTKAATTQELVTLAKYKGWSPKKVRDTVRRLHGSGKIFGTEQGWATKVRRYG